MPELVISHKLVKNWLQYLNVTGDCPSGQEANGGQCVVCPKGKYRDKAIDGFQCKDCPSGYTTASTGTTSSSSCSLCKCKFMNKSVFCIRHKYLY